MSEMAHSSAVENRSGSLPLSVVAVGTVFFVSAFLMALEVTAGRMISREMGSSLYTWTSVIGVVLGGMSLGNTLGGWMADRFAPRRAIPVLLVAASAGCVGAVVLNGSVDAWSLLWGMTWPVRVSCRVTIVFLLPAVLLGAVVPVAAKLALDVGPTRGRMLGNVYAWGNVGSLLGTFAVGFWLIAEVGTVEVVWLISGGLALLGLVWAPRNWWVYGWGVLWGFFAVVGLGPWSWAESSGEALFLRKVPNPYVIYEDESHYSYIKIVEKASPQNARVMLLDRLIHSEILVDDPYNLQTSYERVYALLTHRFWSDKKDLRTLTVGGGGYVLPQYLTGLWPGAVTEVAEIDPEVTAAARATFGLPEATPIGIHHMDGRNLVDAMARRKRQGGAVSPYDVIYVDAFNDCSVPFHLTTLEYTQMVREILSPKGMYLVNLIDNFGSGQFLGAVVNTFSRVFPYVYVVVSGELGTIDPDSRETFIVVGSMRELDLSELGRRDSDRPKSPSTMLDETRMAYLRWRSAGMVLTDDYAPVENLLLPVVRTTLLSREMEMTRRAIDLMKQGRYAEAESYFNRALEIEPGFPAAHQGLVQSLLLQGKGEEAGTALQRILAIHPEDSFALVTLGRLLTEAGRLDEGLAYLERAVTVPPPSVEARLWLSVALAKAGRMSEAIEQGLQAVSINGAHVPARLHLAELYLSTGAFAEAVEQSRAVLQSQPELPAACGILGQALLAMNRYAEAIQVISPVVEKRDVPVDALNALAWVLATCPDKALRDGDRAIRVARRACELTGQADPNSLRILAVAYAATGQFGQAITAAEQALAIVKKGRDQSLAQDIENRLAAYRQGRVYEEPTAPR